MGSMGFMKLEYFNRSSHAQQFWRMIENHTSLAARVVKAKYSKDEALYEAKCNSHSSFMWKSLI